VRTLSFLAALSILAGVTTLAGADAHAFVPPKHTPLTGRLDMVYVASASYRFGAEAKWQGTVPGNVPASGIDPSGIDVHVNAFYIDRTEVSAGSYMACVAAGVCQALTLGDTDRPKFSVACTYGKPGLENHPINCVAHSEAVAYCGFVGKRLPTEAEWELASRGTQGKPFPWGDTYPTPRHINACDASLQRESMSKLSETYTSMWGDTGDDGWAFTAPVGSYPDGASPYGALDLAGNVEEWLADAWWDFSASGMPKTPSTTGNEFVVRGGAWDLSGADNFAVTRRLRQDNNTRSAWLGFRCASDP
jgi:formylglycine-generating enzyme required for sulfatase activity